MKLGLGLGLEKHRPQVDQAGILDDYPPYAAWGLSYVVSSYTGDVVLVRRSPGDAQEGFTPSEITSGALAAWVGGGNNGFVVTRYDQIGSNHATQATPGNQALIVESGTLVTDPDNGLPAIKYEITGTKGDSVTFPAALTQPNTKFLIGHSVNASSNQIFSGSPNSSARNQITYLVSNGGELSLFSGASYTPGSVTGLLNSTWLAYALFNGASSQLGVNGAAASTGNAGTQSNEGYQLPTTSGIRGYWQLEVLYNSNESANRTAIETAINSIYSIY